MGNHTLITPQKINPGGTVLNGSTIFWHPGPLPSPSILQYTINVVTTPEGLMTRRFGIIKKVLLADDHSPTQMMFSHILDGQRYQIIHASNGEEAYSLAVFERPQLILMDVMMPVMDGYEALAKIKEDPVTRAIPVMMFTATDRSIERRLARELGAMAYMVKPVRVDEFHRNINCAMACAA